MYTFIDIWFKNKKEASLEGTIRLHSEVLSKVELWFVRIIQSRELQ